MITSVHIMGIEWDELKLFSERGHVDQQCDVMWMYLRMGFPKFRANLKFRIPYFKATLSIKLAMGRAQKGRYQPKEIARKNF